MRISRYKYIVWYLNMLHDVLTINTFDILIFLNEYYTIYDIPMYHFPQRGTIYGNFLVSDAEGKKINMNFDKLFYTKQKSRTLYDN